MANYAKPSLCLVCAQTWERADMAYLYGLRTKTQTTIKRKGWSPIGNFHSYGNNMRPALVGVTVVWRCTYRGKVNMYMCSSNPNTKLATTGVDNTPKNLVMPQGI